MASDQSLKEGLLEKPPACQSPPGRKYGENTSGLMRMDHSESYQQLVSSLVFEPARAKVFEAMFKATNMFETGKSLDKFKWVNHQHLPINR